jgi:hypothetical protein
MRMMNKISSFAILAIIASGMFVQINPIFAPSHPEFTEQSLMFYGKGTIDESSPFAGQTIRTPINDNVATIIRPSTHGIEVVRADITPSEICIQTQDTLCYDGTITTMRNVEAHKAGDKITVTLDLQNKKEMISFESGSMAEASLTIDLSKTITRPTGPFVLVLSQEGGFAGISKSITIDSASEEMRIEEGSQSSVSLLHLGTIEKIIKDLKKSKFFDMKQENYPPIEGSADYFVYSITVNQGMFQKTITWTDTSENIPQNLMDLKEEIELITGGVPAEPSVGSDFVPVVIAKDFVVTSPTFAFDGIPDTLQVGDVMVLESFPQQYVVTINFDSLHGGYGNRTGQILTQAITPHVIVVTIVEDKVVSAFIDDGWDELNQAKGGSSIQ